MSQFRVWPLPHTIIVTFGKRNRNPGHRFAGQYLLYSPLSLKEYQYNSLSNTLTMKVGGISGDIVASKVDP